MTERSLGVTRACGLVGISRSLYRYRSRRPDCIPLRSRIEEIAAIVDRFLANRQPEATPLPAPAPPVERPTANPQNGAPARSQASAAGSSNGHQAAEFVSEDDVRRAIQKGEKIYVGPKTIITPSARDIGDPAEVFAKA